MYLAPCVVLLILTVPSCLSPKQSCLGFFSTETIKIDLWRKYCLFSYYASLKNWKKCSSMRKLEFIISLYKFSVYLITLFCTWMASWPDATCLISYSLSELLICPIFDSPWVWLCKLIQNVKWLILQLYGQPGKSLTAAPFPC